MVVVGASLAGCGGESHQDLRAWMARAGQGRARASSTRCRRSSPYEPFAYNAFDLPDPFKPRKIEPTKGGSKLAPDLARRREPLEAFPLESLTMVGTLEKNKAMYALVRTPEKDIYQVRVGQLHGTGLRRRSSASATPRSSCRELVQDGAGDWTERTSSLQLQQPQDNNAQGRKR